ncbi:GNAT family N-acetyltransferase [Oceanobacillus bengalensis]|uniref:GNAT family N-acetyltransferase n=1 Tax=Oceanobacillus bengalensis TaxID=1435466 RepID=A0A494Z3A5_9BACI|nr:GNAT family N-acetyltransferase [Oceanobacillus bengalensis]RKQ16784.1 GNAT family N-acetyltransferase [Oceanobacillus bengalensis]
MRLVEPTMEWKEEHENYVKEWGNTRLVPSSFNLEGFETYESFLEALRVRQSGQGKWVPGSDYFLVNDDNRIVGMVNIRHELNEFLRQVGGHIGYGVRPSERRKGYATLILKEALAKCKELNINPVLVTCDEDNIGSAKVIIKNGGIEDESFLDEDGSIKRRFWIEN